MEKKITCGSCRKDIANDSGSVHFPCPSCAKQEIIRCFACRQKGVVYTCKECEFKGPN